MPTGLPATADDFTTIPAGTKQGTAIGGRTHREFHIDTGDAIEVLTAMIGTEAVASDILNYVRLYDGVSKGLWVPSGSLVSPSLIANSNYDHWQRGAAARTHTTTYNTDTSYSADRFFTRPAGASVTSLRSTTTPDIRSQFSCQINGAVSVTTIDHGQRIPSVIVNTRGRQPLIFSAYILNQTGAAFTPNLRIGTPAAVDDFTTVTNRLDQALQSCADNAWTLVYFAFDPTGYTNVSNGMEAVLRTPSGAVVAADAITISQFDLRPGSRRMAFAAPDPRLELLRCLPFYCKTFEQGVAPAQNSGTRLGAVGYVCNVAGTAGAVGIGWRFPVPMRTAPTITTFNPNAANANWWNSGDSLTSGVAAPYNTGDCATTIFNPQVATDGTGEQIAIHATANAEL